MAVSGRKHQDFQFSMSKDSTEFLNHECDPCLSHGQHEDAHGYCVKCKEYLCKSCFIFHQSTRALKHHQLLDIDTLGEKKTSSAITQVCTEKCDKHATGIIKFFCQVHKALGCHDCMTMDHRTCQIDYIPDNCADIGDSEEYKGTLWLLNQKLKEIDSLMKKATVRDNEIGDFYANLIQEIVKFRKEINDRLDQLQTEIQKKADTKKFDDKQIVKKVLKTCTNASADFNQLQSNLCNTNVTKQNGQLYINIKQAQSKLKSDEVQTAEEALEKTNIQYTYERNKSLEDVLSKPNILGNLNLSKKLVEPRRKVDKLIKKEDINVKTKPDTHEYDCYLSGCAVLSSHKLVLADYYNNKLKVVDIQSSTVTEEKKLDSRPWDIVVLPKDQVAVTLPKNKEIIIMKAASKLSTIQKTPVKCKCYGITYHEYHLYVVCQKPNSVLVLDIHGNVQYKVSLNNDKFNIPQYIVISEDSRHIYVSDYVNDCIASITLQGDVSAVYRHEELEGPQGMVMLDDESLLVCCNGNDTIHHISGDLKQGRTIVIDGIYSPECICYSHHNVEVYVGCWGELKRYSLK